MSFMRRARTALLLCIGLAGPARADRIVLTSGGSLEGEVVRETPEAVLLKSAHGTLEIRRDQIASVERKGYVPPPRGTEPEAEPSPPIKPPPPAESPDRAALESALNSALPSFDRFESSRDAEDAAARLVALGKDLVPVILERLPTLEPPRQMWLVQALEQLADPRASDTLLALLASPKGEVRGAAIHALGVLQEKAAVQPLIRLLGSEGDWTVKREACRALLALKAREAIPALVERLADVSRFVRAEALEALQGLTGERRSGDPAVWKDLLP